MRPSGRSPEQMRSVKLETGFSSYAEGSCLTKFGDTHVLCNATVEERVPPWLRGKGQGWVTAEYGMLPRATGERMRREASAGKQSGRTQEIQRLIGRQLLHDWCLLPLLRSARPGAAARQVVHRARHDQDARRRAVPLAAGDLWRRARARGDVG